MKKIYKKNIKNLIRVLKGDIELVLKNSYADLKKLTKVRNYEQALRLRNKIQSFERLIQQSNFSSDITVNYNRASESLTSLNLSLQKYFPGKSTINRIECYDISNLLLKDATASMVVFSDGLPDKSQYRRFKIKNPASNSDFQMLEEVFKRRFKQDWTLPDLIVVDGGTPQVIRVKKVLSDLNINLPLIGIAKHPDRLIINMADKLLTRRPAINDLGYNLIRSLRDEAHRFARKYHLLLRSKKMLL